MFNELINSEMELIKLQRYRRKYVVLTLFI